MGDYAVFMGWLRLQTNTKQNKTQDQHAAALQMLIMLLKVMNCLFGLCRNQTKAGIVQEELLAAVICGHGRWFFCKGCDGWAERLCSLTSVFLRVGGGWRNSTSWHLRLFLCFPNCVANRSASQLLQSQPSAQTVWSKCLVSF